MEYCKHKDSFCYICGHFVAKRNKKKRNESFVVMYRACFDDAEWIDEPFAPKVGCPACYFSMKKFTDKTIKNIKYDTPMTWYNPGDHNPDTCYFCVHIKRGINTPKSQNFNYQVTPYVEFPELYTEQDPQQQAPQQAPQQQAPQQQVDDEGAGPSHENVDADDFFDMGMDFDDAGDGVNLGVSDPVSRDVHFMDFSDDVPELSVSSYRPPPQENIARKLITQVRLNNMCRRMHASQRQSKILAEMLKEDGLLAAGVKIKTQSRQAEFNPFFTKDEETDLTYCSNIRGLMEKLKIVYEVDEWRLFIDGSKSALKAVLLHNDGAYRPVPIAYTRTMKETYDSMKIIFEKIKYNEHQWDVSGDLKVVALIMGLQLGRTRNSCIFCTWISTAKINHYCATWELRGDYVIGEMNVRTTSLVPREKILLPTLHIKLGIMTQFIKKLGKDSDAFNYLSVLFPKLSKKKIAGGNLYVHSFSLILWFH